MKKLISTKSMIRLLLTSLVIFSLFIIVTPQTGIAACTPDLMKKLQKGGVSQEEMRTLCGDSQDERRSRLSGTWDMRFKQTNCNDVMQLTCDEDVDTWIVAFQNNEITVSRPTRNEFNETINRKFEVSEFSQTDDEVSFVVTEEAFDGRIRFGYNQDVVTKYMFTLVGEKKLKGKFIRDYYGAVKEYGIFKGKKMS